MTAINKRNERLNKQYELTTGKKVCKGHDRNEVLANIPKDTPVKVTFLIDTVSMDKFKDNVKVIGAHNVQMIYNGETYYIDHIWLRSDQVPSIKKIDKKHIGKSRTITAMIKEYVRDNRIVKYEFVTK